MKASRAYRNIISNFAVQIISAIAGIIIPKLIIIQYGSTINGMVGSVGQFLMYAGLVEAGIGNASIVALYKPLTEKSWNDVNVILSEANRKYRKSGFIYILITLLIACIYPFFVSDQIDYSFAFNMTILLSLMGVIDYFLIGKYKVLLTADNKYYIVILIIDVLRQTYSSIINMGIYFMTYVLGKAELLGTFSGAINLALIIGLAFLPALVAKHKGYYKLNFSGYVISALGRGVVVVAGYIGSVPLMLVGTAIGAIGMSPWQGNLNALVAECSEHTFLKYGKRIDGTMYSCTSMGLKLGGGLGIAIVGWLLDLGGFDGQLAVQSQSCINMLHFMYLWLPMIINIIIVVLLTQLNVEKANEKLRAEKAIIKK